MQQTLTMDFGSCEQEVVGADIIGRTEGMIVYSIHAGVKRMWGDECLSYLVWFMFCTVGQEVVTYK